MRYAIALLLPFTAWSVAFLAIYGVQTVGCAAGWQHVELSGISLLRLVLIAMLAATIALVAISGKAVVAAMRRRASQVMTDVAYYTAIAAAVSTAVIFVGVFWLRLC